MNIVLSGPSGAGKGLIAKRLKETSMFLKSVSYTTRKQREGEIVGWDYFYKNKEEFLDLQEKNFFFEVAEYDGNYYGIPRQNISLVGDNKNTLFDLIPSSGLNIKKNFDSTCLVYILPPNEEVLKFRRGNRGDSRLIRDIEQFELAQKYYDYLIVNNNIEDTLDELHDIIRIFQKNSISNNQEFMNNYFTEKRLVKTLMKSQYERNIV